MEYLSKDVEEMLNKKEFIEEVAKRCMLTTYVVEEIYNVSSGLIAEKLISGESVTIPNIGKFEVREMNAKNLAFSNSNTCVYPALKVSNMLKNRIKNGYKYKKMSKKLGNAF